MDYIAQRWLQLEIASLLLYIRLHAYIKILLFGSRYLSSEDNILFFRATQNFILNSDRFSRHNNIIH